MSIAAKTRRKKQGSGCMTWGCGIMVAAMAGMIALSVYNLTRPQTAEEKRAEARGKKEKAAKAANEPPIAKMLAMSHEAVKARLSKPMTANFGTMSMKYRTIEGEPDQHAIFQEFTAQNKLGLTVKHTYRCDFKSAKRAGGYESPILLSVEIDGEEQ